MQCARVKYFTANLNKNMIENPSGQFGMGQDRRIALLEDVFKKFPQIPVNIEVKQNNDLLIQKVFTIVLD